MDRSGREGGGDMKTAILRLGVALILSATGLIVAKFVSRKEDDEFTSSASNPESSSSPNRRNYGEEEEEEEEESETVDHQILKLDSGFDEFQKKENEMELSFKRYCNLKDQEVLLMELKSMLSLEKSQLEFFHKEFSAMGEEHKRGQDLVMVYAKVVGEIQGLRSKNRLLEEKAKKLRRKGKQLYDVVIRVEKEFLKCLDELEKKNNVVKKLEDEVKVLQEVNLNKNCVLGIPHIPIEVVTETEKMSRVKTFKIDSREMGCTDNKPIKEYMHDMEERGVTTSQEKVCYAGKMKEDSRSYKDVLRGIKKE